ncbi:MAG: GvpL/GvpF family gas vesicle protein [Ktedonobacterales bacterium]
MSSTQPQQADHQAGTYIYCVTSAQAVSQSSQALSVTGVGGQPVRAVPYSDLAAVVSDSPFDSYDVTRENLTAHEQVVENVMRQSDVLPVSFGTVAENDQAVQQQLLSSAFDDIHQALNRVHDRVELGVKVLWERDRLFADLAAEDDSIRALRDEIAGSTPDETYDERTQLGELIAAGIEQKRDQDATAILSQLQPLAVDVRTNPPYGDMMVLNASFLVDMQQIPAFEAQVDSLRQAQAGRLIFSYTGPLPPYNFVTIAASQAEQQGDQNVNVEVAG